MQNVEDAVGHHHFLAALARRRNRLFELLFAHHAKAGLSPAADRVFQLDRGNGGCTQLTDHHARRGVSEIAGLFQGVAGRQGRRQHANHRVAGAGHVVHFLGLGRHMQRRTPRLQQRHPLLRARHQQRRQFEFGDELHAALNDLRFILALAHHRFKLREVRGEQRRAAIAFEIGAFRIDQHRHARFACESDHGLDAGQRPFGIVRKDQRANRAQRLLNALVHRLRIDAGEALFKVEADQLLIARQHPQLGDSRVSRDGDEVALHIDVGQRLAQRAGGVINPGQSHQARGCPQRGNVHRYVCRAARTFFDIFHLHHRHRGFRGNTTGGAVPVAVQHHITHHQHSCTFKLRQRYFHDSLLRDANFARDNSTPDFIVKPSAISASWR